MYTCGTLFFLDGDDIISVIFVSIVIIIVIRMTMMMLRMQSAVQ